MAHSEEPFRPDRRTSEAAERCAWDHIRRVFGRQPSAIRPIVECGDTRGAYFVTLEWNLNQSFEFICVNGLLVEIPSKGRR
ncbi:MAG TPA: hypothetical protein VFZ59_05290 [Verrucomicrobiae bacterium]|nr:hypothetical protein [Verrucomicrobiae bacterium]